MPLIFREFKPSDMFEINLSENHFEYELIDNPELYAQGLSDLAIINGTAEEDGKIIFCLSILPMSPECLEVIFIISKEFQENFSKYGLPVIRKIKKEFKTLLAQGVDNLYSSCYNISRARELIELFNFEYSHSIKDKYKRPIKYFKYRG